MKAKNEEKGRKIIKEMKKKTGKKKRDIKT